MAHVAKMHDEEARNPEQWWYLSFVDPRRPKGTQFLGACVVRGRGILTAMRRAHVVGCNPGGEVACFAVGQEMPPFPTNKLLQKEDMGPSGGGMSYADLKARGVI